MENNTPVDKNKEKSQETFEPALEKKAEEGTKTEGITEKGETTETVNIEEFKRQYNEQLKRSDEYYQRLVRMQADFENYRRRVGKEKEELLKFAAEDLIVKLLPVLDNFERALVAPVEDNQNTSQFKEGIEMIYRQFIDVLVKEGLSIITTVGQQFDPVNHEVILQEETGGQPDNNIIEELRRGYFFKGKVIRPAWVKVARSGIS
ncbi:MAG: nucleotide exchange factor GrpE [Peptococcaceae bacterium]